MMNLEISKNFFVCVSKFHFFAYTFISISTEFF